MNNNLNFSIQTLEIDHGKSLPAMESDANGFYTGIPIAIIGRASRNNSLYDPASFVDAMTNPNCKFFKALQEGHLEGEWGHPMHNLNKTEFVNRVLQIDRNNVSHYFRKVWTVPSSDGSYMTVYADIKPCGGNGKYLNESFMDGNRNTAFSLRSLTKDIGRTPQGATRKKVLSVVTFDAVDIPGYEEASKRFSISQESLGFEIVDNNNVEITIDEIIQFPDFAKVVGFEAVQCQEILDALETDVVKIKRSVTIAGKYDKDSNSIVTSDGQRKSIFHSIF